jgi:hypothetical protein
MARRTRKIAHFRMLYTTSALRHERKLTGHKGYIERNMMSFLRKVCNHKDLLSSSQYVAESFTDKIVLSVIFPSEIRPFHTDHYIKA